MKIEIFRKIQNAYRMLSMATAMKKMFEKKWHPGDKKKSDYKIYHYDFQQFFDLSAE